MVKIEPEQIKKFEEVAAEIKQTLATDRARSEIATRHDKIEDERGGGARLTEIAQKLGLTARTIEAVDRSGLDPEGKPVAGWPSGVNPITSAFGTDVGVDNEPMQIPGGGYVWYEVAERQAVARAHARRGARAGRGALAQRGDLQAPARPRRPR